MFGLREAAVLQHIKEVLKPYSAALLLSIEVL